MAHLSAKSIKNFCEAWGLSETTVYRLIASKRLRAVKVGRKTLITADAERDWLASLPAAELTTGLNVSVGVAA